MARRSGSRKTVQMTLRIDEQLAGWLGRQIGPGMRFHNPTHAFERAIRLLMTLDALDKEENPMRERIYRKLDALETGDQEDERP